MFSYDNLMDEVRRLNAYGVETGVVGTSECGLPVPYVFVGKKCNRNMIVTGAIHAREHLTALVTLCLAKDIVKHCDRQIYGGIYFVPMVNPDGVRLCQEGTGFVADKSIETELLRLNGESNDFSLWKANARGVDLNVNFDADWGKGASNVFQAAAENYVGSFPLCAAESRALARFTQLVKPVCTLSYHLKGEEIYWYFGQCGASLQRDKKLAEALSARTGYKLVSDTRGSAGGYKDWCIKRFGIPSFTVEIGNDKFAHPFPYTELRTVLSQNDDLPRLLLNTIVKQA